MAFIPAPYIGNTGDNTQVVTNGGNANNTNNVVMSETNSILNEIKDGLSGPSGQITTVVTNTPIDNTTVAANVAYTKLSLFQGYSNLKQMFLSAFCGTPTGTEPELQFEFATSIDDSTSHLTELPNLTIILNAGKLTENKTWSTIGGTAGDTQVLGQYLWYKATISAGGSFPTTTLKAIYRL